MHDDTIRLRQPRADELEAWVAPGNAAFGAELNHAEWEHDRLLYELDRLIGAVDGETWVGTGGAYSMGLTVPGGAEVGAAGITMIGVAPSHRRRGILRRMMRWMVDQAHERDEPVAILWASESAIYQRFGFGIGTLQGVFDIETTRARFNRPAEPLGRMRIVDRDEAMGLVPSVYDAVRPRIPGSVSRTEDKWRHELLSDAEWMRRGNGPKYMAVLEVDGDVRGYAIYRVRSEWDDRGPNNVVTSMEVIGLDAAAERALWAWLFGLDLVGHVRGWRVAVPNPLMLQLTEPRRMGMTIREGMWLRVLDVAAALEARSYRGSGSITFELADEFCPWNNGRWRLEVGGDSGSMPGARSVASVAPFTGDPDLTLDASDLSTIYLGAFTFADLGHAGRVGECRPGALTDADGLFATAVAPWCSTMF